MREGSSSRESLFRVFVQRTGGARQRRGWMMVAKTAPHESFGVISNLLVCMGLVASADDKPDAHNLY